MLGQNRVRSDFYAQLLKIVCVCWVSEELYFGVGSIIDVNPSGILDEGMNRRKNRKLLHLDLDVRSELRARPTAVQGSTVARCRARPTQH